MAGLDRLARNAPGGLAVAGVSVDRDMRLAQEYLRRAALFFPNAWEGEARELSLGLGITTLPQTFVISADGRLAWHVSGARDWGSSAMVVELGARLAATGGAVTGLR